MRRYLKILAVIAFIFTFPLSSGTCFADDMDSKLATVAAPYVKYFTDRAMGQNTGFGALTRSFQLYLGGQTPVDEAVINYGAASYDQSILGRICASGGSRAVLDTYMSYATAQKLAEVNNPVINCNGSFYGAGGPSDRILYGLYRVVRIDGRSIPYWYNTWDWIVDTGATACTIVDALDAYQKTSNADYKNFAVLLGGYILKLQDSDGGIRYGPRGMYHSSGTDFFWNLKSTEQNERCLSAFTALYAVTSDTRYNQASIRIKSWLKSMYNQPKHLFHSAESFDGASWVKSNNDAYIATDVTAFAPLDMMFSDAFFGVTQAARDAEVDAMFTAIETKTAFLDANNRPLFFRFSRSQEPDPVKGDYGSVEWSAQMALGYLKAAQAYAPRDRDKTRLYADKYYNLTASLRTYFTVPSADPDSKVAPYASYYLDKSVAGNVPTGTGYFTFNCNATLAALYYVFAEAGYDPSKLGGGAGIPMGIYNSIGMPWYQNTPPYNSTAAAVCQMLLNFLRDGTGKPALTQQAIYEYAKSPKPYGPELNPDEIAKVLGHFDPYDSLVSNWSNGFDSLPGGNPYKGYNFSVDTYDPLADPDAINKYMRDICHWMAYTVTREDWWLDGLLVVHPNTPAVIPLYGTYSHWVAVKGYVASTNPCPQPHVNPFNTPDFIVYGYWIKDPLISGIGQDTYKTAAECKSSYFLPLSATDSYNGKFVQVAEPPPQISKAHVQIPQPTEDLGNLDFIGVKRANISSNSPQATNYSVAAHSLSAAREKAFIKKQSWLDVLPGPLLSDYECVEAFTGTKRQDAVLVKRADIQDSDYYVVPFNKTDKKGMFLTSGVIMLDANTGYFKEASWTKVPEKFLTVAGKDAMSLIVQYINKDLLKKLQKLPRVPVKQYLKQRDDLFKDYSKLIGYLNSEKKELCWQLHSGYSISPYKPYWKIDANGYIWYVTQEKNVVSEMGLDKIIAEIDVNRRIIEKRYPGWDRSDYN